MWRWGFLLLAVFQTFRSTSPSTLANAHLLQQKLHWPSLWGPPSLWGAPRGPGAVATSAGLSLHFMQKARNFQTCRAHRLCASFLIGMRNGYLPNTRTRRSAAHEEDKSPAVCPYSGNSLCLLSPSRKEAELFAHHAGKAPLPGEEEESFQMVNSDSLLPPRGFRDFPPKKFFVLKNIFSVWRRVAEEFGFQEYKGPSVERCTLYSHFPRRGLTGASCSQPSQPSPLHADTPENSHWSQPAATAHGTVDTPEKNLPPHIYRLEGSRSSALCLRPELTPSLARMLQRDEVENPSGLARRWFSIERVWRHERPGRGRRREHFQWNLDVAFPSGAGAAAAGAAAAGAAAAGAAAAAFSSSLNETNGEHDKGKEIRPCGKRHSRESTFHQVSTYAAAELIAVAVRLFQVLGFSPADVRIRIGSRALLCDLLQTQNELSELNNTEETVMPSGDGGDTPQTNNSFLLHSPTGIVSSRSEIENDFSQRLMRALQVLDRAGRRPHAETEASLGEALGITRDASKSLLNRLRSFDIQNDEMVRQLAERLTRLPALTSPQNGVHEGGSLQRRCLSKVSAEEIPASVQEMRSLLRLLDEGYGVAEWVDVDLLIVRGLHYYTGIVFEAFDAESSLRAILGGGCYGEPRHPAASAQPVKAVDGRSVRRPGVTGAGFGMGDCVLLELLKQKHLLPVSRATLDILVVLLDGFQTQQASQSAPLDYGHVHEENEKGGHSLNLDTDSRVPSACFAAASSSSSSQVTAAQALCCKLRARGLRVELLLPPQRSRRAAIKHAKSLGAKAVVFLLGKSNNSNKNPGEKSVLSPSLGQWKFLAEECKETAGSGGFQVVLLDLSDMEESSTRRSEHQRTK